ncbi:hypothetical protein HPB49_010876 [Dermacentor silvarum]|uniref:Uncharacterized protein n=1 Tax=Dermacentor silvarum TaxID=543639 RepID=A0ACB8CEI0_DERSI|nr:hypothetical protein HPB49_010876 [Dermacentor silvarum]
MAVVLSEIDEDSDLFPLQWRCWRIDWMGRKELGVQNLLYEELLKTDLDEYWRLLRVSRKQFLQLLSRVEPRIRREDTIMRLSISAEALLQVTLWYLDSGAPGVEAKLLGSEPEFHDFTDDPASVLPPAFGVHGSRRRNAEGKPYLLLCCDTLAELRMILKKQAAS